MNLRSLLIPAVCVTFTFATLIAYPQATNSSPAIVAAPSQTPDDFMRAAVRSTDLTAPDMQPWHLRAHYRQFKPDGTINREGIFEEWWANPTRSKVVSSEADFNRTEYRTAAGTFYTGSDTSAPAPGIELLLHPLPYPALLDRLTFTMNEVTVGSTRLQCYGSKMKDPGHAYRPQAYCFTAASPAVSSPALRAMEDGFDNRTSWNQLVPLHDRVLAQQVRQTNAQHQPVLTIDVEEMDATLGTDEASIAPPADAKPALPRKVAVSSGVMQQYKLSGDSPQYPGDAKAARVQGTVVIQATISPKGAIQMLRVVSGPRLLQEAAINAVKTWRFAPYLLNGDPVQVETTMNVVFNLAP